MQKYVAEFIRDLFSGLTIECTVVGHGAGPLAPLASVPRSGDDFRGRSYLRVTSIRRLRLGRLVARKVRGLGCSAVHDLSGHGGGLAALVVKLLKEGPLLCPSNRQLYPRSAEFLFTFALVYVVLNVATAKGTSGNSFYGLAIGFTVLVGRFPSATSRWSVQPLRDGHLRSRAIVWANIWIYLIAEFGGPR